MVKLKFLIIICATFLVGCRGEQMTFVYKDGKLYCADPEYYLGEGHYLTGGFKFTDFKMADTLDLNPVKIQNDLNPGFVLEVWEKANNNVIGDVYHFSINLLRDTVIHVYPIRA